MKEIKRADCILVNTDCVSAVQSFDGKTLKVTLRNGEQMNIPSCAFGATSDGLAFLPAVIPFRRMSVFIKNGKGIERRPVHLMTVMGGVMQPVCIDMGEISYPVDLEGYIGMQMGDDFILALGELKV